MLPKKVLLVKTSKICNPPFLTRDRGKKVPRSSEINHRFPHIVTTNVTKQKMPFFPKKEHPSRQIVIGKKENN